MDTTSQSPPKPSSPASPSTPHFNSQQSVAPRSFINLNSDVRGQVPAFPATPISAHHNINLDPPSGSSYADFLRTWTDTHVARWLSDIKCSSHAELFKANDIRSDILLELDQLVLKEMGVASIGDRLRILNAVKILRQRVSSKVPLPRSVTQLASESTQEGQSSIDKSDISVAGRTINRRLEAGRPAPLQLNHNTNRSDLPAIIREQPPDSARGNGTHPIRPLPQPTYSSSTPLPSSRPWPNSNNANHARNGSLTLNSPNSNVPSSKLPPRPSTTNSHPYANAQPTLHPPTNHAVHNLSPIEESFSSQHSTNSPSPPSQGHPINRSANIPSVSHGPYSLDDLRRKVVKFMVPDEGLTFKIDVANCTNGSEILEKVLKKFGKGGSRSTDAGNGFSMEYGYTDDNRSLVLDGWGLYSDSDDSGDPLSESQILSICQAPPDNPTRENGLILRRVPRPRHVDDGTRSSSPGSQSLLPPQTSKSTKRASSISILSGLGVRDPEKALDPPSPTSGRLSPATLNAKRPSKLRNFFGQRPPSELITTHLTEYFPFTEKRVLERTARHSMLRSNTLSSTRRESIASFTQPLPSRFSSSTQGSQPKSSSSPRRASMSSVAPPLPDKYADMSPGEESPTEEIPRMSLSTEDGRSIDLHLDGPNANSPIEPTPQLLPPIPFPTESLSESIEGITGSSSRARPTSRAMSISSRRMSYMTELRSKRDRSDTASLMTVDEITAEVARRTDTTAVEEGSDDDWTKVDTDNSSQATQTLVDDEEDEEEEEDASLDDDEDEDFPKSVAPRTANKWIKGALIGAGSFGKVYLGMDASNGLLMAVKQVELPTGSGPNEERKKSMLSALEREIELLKNLQHENIVQYLYSSIEDEYLNIFLEYVPGGSVTALLRNYGAFEEPLVKNFVRQILQGLDYLHQRDIIHRDIKGANILVDNKGGIKISDFGISKKVDDNLLTGNRMHRPSLQGSVFWMAPEVVKQSGHTKKADIWSVGCLVVEMLTGEHPWAQLTQMQAIFKIGSSAKPTIPSDISAEAQDFLERTFELDQDARPSADDLLLHTWIGKKPSNHASKGSGSKDCN
ncbi:hypothetical protein BDQ17DRAFT_1295818 [Cyathus striatus]|nr:hypothetical protein BDQ17DRAFT_1295818 [Cyathus striatus]